MTSTVKALDVHEMALLTWVETNAAAIETALDAAHTAAHEALTQIWTPARHQAWLATGRLRDELVALVAMIGED